MIASVDPYLARSYDARHYDCLAFARDVWRDHVGEDLGRALEAVLNPGRRRPTRDTARSFRRLDAPRDPCLVLMRQRHPDTLHVGVYLRGKVLHLGPAGAEFMPVAVASRGFTHLRFYEPTETR